MLSQSSIDFLRDLSRNNNREWFTQNKARYERELRKPFESFVGAVIDAFKAEDPGFSTQPKDAIFRIYRDTRFSKDKRPYKENVGALISRNGRRVKEAPGFYLHLEGGMLMLGGGAYFVEAPTLQRIRQFIMINPGRFAAIVKDPLFVEKYGQVQGEENKRLSPELAEFARQQPLIAKKQFYYMAELPPQTILQPDAVEVVMEYFRAGKDFNEFFEEAISS